jgi:hypothetical protein
MPSLSYEIHVPSTSTQVVQLKRPEPGDQAKQPKVSDVQLARIAARNHWVGRYAAEQSRLTNGRMDHDIAHTEGVALYHVVGHRPPEDVARLHFNAYTGAADTLTSAATKFRELAAEVGLTEAGAELTQAQFDFAHGVAELCAAVGDQIRTVRDGSAGDLIRANYGPVPF